MKQASHERGPEQSGWVHLSFEQLEFSDDHLMRQSPS